MKEDKNKRKSGFERDDAEIEFKPKISPCLSGVWKRNNR